MTTPSTEGAAFRAELAGAFDADFATDDPVELAEFGKDWTRVYPPRPSFVVFPRTTDEVSRFMSLCNARGMPVVPSGGRTGLAGGAVATSGEVVLSLSRMRRIDPIDELGATVRVQAGAITEQVHRHCAEKGLTWPIDFASKGSSQIGGNIATNAGGVKVLRYGLTRQWVLGLEVVLASGTVLALGGALEKNNTGPDLRQLFIGSEGTLGVITEATLKLTKLPGDLRVMLFTVHDLGAVLSLFQAARSAPFTLTAYEFFTDKCLARVQRHRKLRDPFDAPSPYYVLVEAEQATEADLEAWVAHVFDLELATGGTLAQHRQQATLLWALREGISESLSATGLPHKNDVALPIARLAGFCAELESVFSKAYPDWEIAVFGHIGDGNLHINVMKPDALEKSEFHRLTKEADHAMFTLVQKHGGSISAEHGVGLLKRDYLHYCRSPAELALFRSIKSALDPNGILNPGKIFEAQAPAR
jgi:FAD/FMN-containing dehydrogenase